MQQQGWRGTVDLATSTGDETKVTGMRFSVWVSAALVGPAAVGCGEDTLESWPEGRPRIDTLSFEQQRSGDPFALDFGIRFTDTDGDLGAGRLHLRIDDEDQSALALEQIFDAQTPPVALDARAGRFSVIARLGEDGIRAGDEVRFTFILEDAAGRRSNEPWLTLRVLAGGGT